MTTTSSYNTEIIERGKKLDQVLLDYFEREETVTRQLLLLLVLFAELSKHAHEPLSDHLYECLRRGLKVIIDGWRHHHLEEGAAEHGDDVVRLVNEMAEVVDSLFMNFMKPPVGVEWSPSNIDVKTAHKLVFAANRNLFETFVRDCCMRVFRSAQCGATSCKVWHTNVQLKEMAITYFRKRGFYADLRTGGGGTENNYLFIGWRPSFNDTPLPNEGTAPAVVKGVD